MANQIHGAMVKHTEIRSEIFEVSAVVRAWKFGEIAHTTKVTIFKSGTEDILAEIDIDHPSDYHVNANNWARYLEYCIMVSPDREYRGVSGGSVKFNRITSRFNIGMSYFLFEGKKDNMAILVDTGTETTISRPINHYTVMSNDFGPGVEQLRVDLNDRRISLSPWIKGKSSAVKGQIYPLAFKKRLTVEQMLTIHVKGTGQLKLTPDMFDYRPQDALHYLVWKSFGDFHYLQTSDGMAVITFDQKPIVSILKAVYDMFARLEKIEKSLSPETMARTSSWAVGDTKKNFDEWNERLAALILESREGDTAIFDHCIEVLDDLWQTSIDFSAELEKQAA